MVFYRAIIELVSLPDEKENKGGTAQIGELNGRFLNLFEEKKLSFLMQTAHLDSDKSLTAFLAYPPKSIGKGILNVEQDICRALELVRLDAPWKGISYFEVTVSNYNRAVEDFHIYSSKFRELNSKQFGADFIKYTLPGCQVSDRMVECDDIADAAAAEAAMAKLLPDAALAAEIGRIFSGRHPKDLFYGIPVHYKLSVKSDIAANEIVDLLVGSLYRNHRILSRRVTRISSIESRCWDRDSFSKLFRCSQGSIVEIALTGDVAAQSEYASQFQEVTDMLAEYIKVHAGDILFIFVENTQHPGFARQLLGKLDEELDILEIKEGVGNAEQAQKYFCGLLADSNMQEFYQNDIVFEQGKFYSATDVRCKFNQWKKERLKDRVYCDYGNNLALRIEKEDRKKGSAFEELRSMVGLTEVKSIISDIIAAFKVQKMRSRFYDPNEAVTRHMVFTGNPGTAKTTVARLLAEILKENNILRTGAFVECGRSDLVAQYVGWTAKAVQEKFKQAQGGILFIDEAYSLVDNSKSFGDEAINTIVQEMENKRDNVLVIFAGYPEKMKDFLAQNEGLRSRIAFHVDFPDYSPEELMGIMEKFLRDRKYTMTQDAKDRVGQIFSQVYTSEEYGNGRFVRNLFEQAVNRQAARILALPESEISRESLFELRSEDFDTNIVKQYSIPNPRRIGFAG